jgi:hypothetical protein
MGEAYWVAGGVAAGEGIASVLRQNGLQPRWIEESHLLAEHIPDDAPGLSFTWPTFVAPSALRWLQGQIASLRHNEREWLLLIQATDEGMAWSVLAGAAGVGRYNRLPQVRLHDLTTRAHGVIFPGTWGDWLNQNAVEFEGDGVVVGLGFSSEQTIPLPAAWSCIAAPWPTTPLPTLLTTWAERVARGAVGVAVLVSAVRTGWIGVAITPV